MKVKSLPPPPPSLAATTVQNFTRTYQCKYCSFNTPWLKDLSQHEKQRHRNYSSHVPEDAMHNNRPNGLAELMIDNVQSFGEIIPSQNEDIIMIEEDLDEDDDEA